MDAIASLCPLAVASASCATASATRLALWNISPAEILIINWCVWHLQFGDQRLWWHPRFDCCSRRHPICWQWLWTPACLAAQTIICHASCPTQVTWWGALGLFPTSPTSAILVLFTVATATCTSAWFVCALTTARCTSWISALVSRWRWSGWT